MKPKNSKLTPEEVRQILHLKEQQKYHAKRAKDLSDANIAGMFGVKKGCVTSIFYQGNWGKQI